MSIANFWRELMRRNRLLAVSGLCYAGLFLVLALAASFDSTRVMGINRWIKPMKFAISIAIFQWTMGWLMKHLEARRDKVRLISRAIVITMLAEIIPIAGQAARGKISHFNTETPFDSVVFSLMGLTIVINTLWIAYALYFYFVTPTNISKAYLWGIRFGLIIFILASAEGGMMAALLRHSVGVPDGGPGLPFVNWSTKGGDLRIAHFIGLHALQALPFAGFAFDRLSRRINIIRPVGWTAAFAAIYFALVTFIFAWAIMGHPLIDLG